MVLPAEAPAHGTVSVRPAAGPSGALATLEGRALPARRRVVVRVGETVAARTRSDHRGSFVARVPTPRGATIATSVVGGPRVRWAPVHTVRGGRVRVTGSGFAPGRGVSISRAGRRLATVRTSRTGRFAVAVRAGRGPLVVRQGRRRLAFAVEPRSADAGPPLPIVSPPPPPAGEPAFPIRAAFYYPWFPEAWSQAGLTPFTKFEPTLGFYDSGSPATIARHLDELAYGHVRAAITSWWGQDHATDQRLPALLQTTRTVGSPIRWAVYYEREGSSDPSVIQIREDLRYLRDRYASDPAYLRVNGRFVVFVYGDAGDGCGTADRWLLANAGIGAYLVLKVGAAPPTCTFGPDAWHKYAPDHRTAVQSGSAFSISPGFWLASEASPRLVRDIRCFRRAVRQMVASKLPWQLVTTFDEWAEGTSVESAKEWVSSSGFGDYLDALHDDGAGAAAPSPC